jgi:hypothetical protein
VSLKLFIDCDCLIGYGSMVLDLVCNYVLCRECGSGLGFVLLADCCWLCVGLCFDGICVMFSCGFEIGFVGW